MPDFLLIANPASGTQAAPQVALEVKQILEAAGKSVDLHLTTGRGDALAQAREAAQRGIKVVVGCGGDGTLQEVATALENTATTLGLIPRGRCNDFARVMGLYRTDSPARVAAVLLAGRRRAVDLGAVGHQRFLTVATLGFDSEASRFVETRRLWIKGTPAYLYAVLVVLSRFRAPLVRLRGDFGVFEGRILLAATGNAPCYGGAMRIAPGAAPDDGLFQICVVEDVSRFTVLCMLPKVLRGTHGTHPKVRMLVSRSVEIETPEGPQWICADGESLCQTPCRFEVRPRVLQVIVP
ncbi:MAG: diacylglycerol kinase family protein [Verrucomicrobiota bacterium]